MEVNIISTSVCVLFWQRSNTIHRSQISGMWSNVDSNGDSAHPSEWKLSLWTHTHTHTHTYIYIPCRPCRCPVIMRHHSLAWVHPEALAISPVPPCQSLSRMPTNPFVQLPCRIEFLGPPEIWVTAGPWYQRLDGVQVSAHVCKINPFCYHWWSWSWF